MIPDWEAAWRHACAAVRDGGRVAVVVLALPTGAAAVLVPLPRLACTAGGADVHRHPWRLLEAETHAGRRRSAPGGHLQVAVGTVRRGGSSAAVSAT